VSSAEFSFKLRVYIEDTDAGGIVYYVNYLKFMERARTEFMRAAGFDRDFIFNHDLMFVVRDVAVRYRKPAILDDELQATARITSLKGASMCFEQRLLRGEEVLASGTITVACVDRSGITPQRIPAAMLEVLKNS
jgi:4-hydroxybenzoyl-CoA thioesterase